METMISDRHLRRLFGWLRRNERTKAAQFLVLWYRMDPADAEGWCVEAEWARPWEFMELGS